MKKVIMTVAIAAMMVGATACTCCNKKAEEAKDCKDCEKTECCEEKTKVEEAAEIGRAHV